MNTSYKANGDVWGDLQKLTKQLQQQITEAGRHGLNAKIFILAERLQHADALAQKYQIIRLELDELANRQNPDSSASTTALPLTGLPYNGSHSQQEPPKTRGKRLRTAWLAKYGKALKQLRRTLYQNSKQEIVGLACATEKRGAKGPEGRWWLGLPKTQFQSAVLLCETSDGNVHAICLPTNFIEAHRSKLSKSEGGQEQFNVFRNGLKWYLQVPTAGTLEVTMYVDNPSYVL